MNSYKQKKILNKKRFHKQLVYVYRISTVDFKKDVVHA